MPGVSFIIEFTLSCKLPFLAAKIEKSRIKSDHEERQLILVPASRT